MDYEALEEAYLSVRYPCTALLVKLRGGCREAWRLEDALNALCEELRAHMRRHGRDRVSRPFDPSLLARDARSLYEECLSAASALRGSRAAASILEALERVGTCIGARAPP